MLVRQGSEFVVARVRLSIVAKQQIVTIRWLGAEIKRPVPDLATDFDEVAHAHVHRNIVKLTRVKQREDALTTSRLEPVGLGCVAKSTRL